MAKAKCLDAAYAVLKQAGEPLHVQELTRRMLDNGAWESNGKTPMDSVNARIAVDIKKNGSFSRFKRVAGSTYELSGRG